jgi:hypothetical protein
MDIQMERRHKEAMKLVPFCDETDRILLLAEVIWPSERLAELESEAGVVPQEPDRPVQAHS